MARQDVIPVVDLKPQYLECQDDLDLAMRRVMQSGNFVLGAEVSRFEAEFARFCGAPFATGVSSGLAALRLALTACGIGPGDEVITAAHTFAATVLAIIQAGAVPVLVDVDEATGNIDPQLVEAAITPRTRAILPVHLYGQAADMTAICEIGRRGRLLVVEDAAQAHGAQYHGQRVGSFGAAACFSFYPTKNLGAAGDGGIVLTSDPGVRDRLEMLRNYGQRAKHRLELIGSNERLDALQAAILSVKLDHLDQWNERRRKLAQQYQSLLGDLPIGLPIEQPGRRHVYHLYVIRTAQRDRLLAHLGEAGVDAAVHYPVPLHRQAALQTYPFAQQHFPVAERLAEQVLSLPMYPHLGANAVERVAEAIRGFFCRRAGRTTVAQVGATGGLQR